jgi:hypothetical protein
MFSQKSPSPEEIKEAIKFNRATISDIAPDLKQALGESILYWVQLESSLSFLFAALVSNNSKIGNSIWDSIVNFQAKLAATDALMQMTDNADFRAIWPTLGTKIRKLSVKRAEIAHSGIVTVDMKEWFLLPHFSITKVDERSQHRYYEADLKRLSEKFKEVKHALEWMFLSLYLEKKILEVDPVRPPRLILQIAQDNNHTLAEPPPHARSFVE